MTDLTLQDIAGILGDTQWDTSGTNNLTFSFPTAASNYGDFYGVEDGNGGAGEPYTGFQPLTPEQQDVVRHDLGLISQYTLLTFTEVTETDDSGAVLRFAESAVPDPATYYSPSQFFGGDVWFGNVYFDDLTKGSYGYSTTLQLIGDVLGLKAGPDPYPYGVLPPEHNSLEWSVMSFSSYIGADPSFYLANDGSGDQTYMINDICRLAIYVRRQFQHQCRQYRLQLESRHRRDFHRRGGAGRLDDKHGLRGDLGWWRDRHL